MPTTDRTLSQRRDELLALLRSHFGPLPQSLIERIERADAPIIEDLFDRALIAGTLRELDD